jgi:hypothetical protein
VDTRNKRASALGFVLAALVVLPAPDAAIGQADRQQVTFSYAGILAESETPEVPDRVSATLNFRTQVDAVMSFRTQVDVTVER